MHRSEPVLAQGQACECFGYWADVDWRQGMVTALGRGGATVETDVGVELRLGLDRFTWKAKLMGWAVWSEQVHLEVRRIEHHESVADKKGVARLRSSPLVGDYVRVHDGTACVSGFLSSFTPNGYVVASSGVAVDSESGRRHVYVSAHDLHWDETDEIWRGRGALRMETKS